MSQKQLRVDGSPVRSRVAFVMAAALAASAIALPQVTTPAFADGTIYIQGTHVDDLDNVDDGGEDNLPIGFTFPFYEGSYTDFHITTNGVLSFGSFFHTWSNRELPASNYDAPAIFPFWDDLHPRTEGDITYRTVVEGEHGNPYGADVLIAQWRNYGYFGSDLHHGTFQVHLVADGRIVFNYNDLIATERAYGQQATLGVQAGGDDEVDEHHQISHNDDAGIRSGFAIELNPDDEDPTFAVSGPDADNFWDVLLFIDIEPPAKPTNPTPAISGEGTTQQTLSWSASARADDYVVIVSENSNLTSPLANETVAATSLSLEDLDLDTTYYWQVRARNTEGSTPSDLWSFEVTSEPTPVAPSPPPAPIAPIPTQDGTLPTLRPGQPGMRVGTEDAPVTVTPRVIEQQPLGVSIAGDGFQIDVEPSDRDGATHGSGTTSGTTLHLSKGEGVKASLTGFAPFRLARMWLFSEPILLGTFSTGADGSLEAAVANLPDEISACRHTIQVESTLTNGQQAAASLGVWLQTDPYPFTDADPLGVHGPAIGCLADIAVTNGASDARYAPHAPATRGHAAAMLARLLGLESVEPSFADSIGTTHEGAIGALEQEGLLESVPGDTFRPGDPITRGELATLIAAAAAFEDGPASGLRDVEGDHAAAIRALVEADIVSGFADGTFRPNAGTTRGQLASMLAALHHRLKSTDS